MSPAGHASGTFTVDSFEPQGSSGHGPATLSRILPTKTFAGDLVGTSRVEMLSAVAADDAAGYVAMEQLDVRLGGRAGGFVLQHTGLVDATGQHLEIAVVPGTGSGELDGLRGRFTIGEDPGGGHTWTFDYDVG